MLKSLLQVPTVGESIEVIGHDGKWHPAIVAHMEPINEYGYDDEILYVRFWMIVEYYITDPDGEYSTYERDFENALGSDYWRRAS